MKNSDYSLKSDILAQTERNLTKMIRVLQWGPFGNASNQNTFIAMPDFLLERCQNKWKSNGFLHHHRHHQHTFIIDICKIRKLFWCVICSSLKLNVVHLVAFSHWYVCWFNMKLYVVFVKQSRSNELYFCVLIRFFVLLHRKWGQMEIIPIQNGNLSSSRCGTIGSMVGRGVHLIPESIVNHVKFFFCIFSLTQQKCPNWIFLWLY